jgi:hypothetical protein
MFGGAGCVDEPTGFDKNRGAIFGRRGLAAAVRSEAEDERPSPAASNPTLSATSEQNWARRQESDSAYAKFKAIFARYSSIGTALRSAIKSLPICPTSVLNFWLSPVARA